MRADALCFYVLGLSVVVCLTPSVHILKSVLGYGCISSLVLFNNIII